MVRKRRNTEEFLNPWSGEAGWKTDPQQFRVISGATQVKRPRRSTGGPRNVKKVIPKKSLIPFNWLQIATMFLGVMALGMMAHLAKLLLG